jgi:hypothetical protein
MPNPLAMTHTVSVRDLKPQLHLSRRFTAAMKLNTIQLPLTLTLKDTAYVETSSKMTDDLNNERYNKKQYECCRHIKSREPKCRRNNN